MANNTTKTLEKKYRKNCIAGSMYLENFFYNYNNILLDEKNKISVYSSEEISQVINSYPKERLNKEKLNLSFFRVLVSGIQSELLNRYTWDYIPMLMFSFLNPSNPLSYTYQFRNIKQNKNALIELFEDKTLFSQLHGTLPIYTDILVFIYFLQALEEAYNIENINPAIKEMKKTKERYDLNYKKYNQVVEQAIKTKIVQNDYPIFEFKKEPLIKKDYDNYLTEISDPKNFNFPYDYIVLNLHAYVDIGCAYDQVTLDDILNK